MQRKYTINHIAYSYSELMLQCEKVIHSNLPTWKRDVWRFIQEWFDDKASITLQTSGSTGSPKSIEVAKEYMRNSARMTLDFLDLKRGDVALLCLSANYIAGKMMIVRALEGGLDLILKEAAGNPLKEDASKLDFAAMVPMQVERVLEEDGPERIRRIKHLIIGGAAVSETLNSKLQELPNTIWATYGMTETVSHVAMKRLSGTTASSFEAMPLVSFSMDDRGCLEIDAPHLSAGRIVTNDVVELIDEKHFTFLGRFDNIINSGGIKLVPEQIEQKISELFSERFIVSSLPDEKLGHKLVIYVETTHPENYIWTALKASMAALLPPFERPKELICVPSFPETKSGKVKRSF